MPWSNDQKDYYGFFRVIEEVETLLKDGFHKDKNKEFKQAYRRAISDICNRFVNMHADNRTKEDFWIPEVIKAS